MAYGKGGSWGAYDKSSSSGSRWRAKDSHPPQQQIWRNSDHGSHPPEQQIWKQTERHQVQAWLPKQQWVVDPVSGWWSQNSASYASADAAESSAVPHKKSSGSEAQALPQAPQDASPSTARLTAARKDPEVELGEEMKNAVANYLEGRPDLNCDLVLLVVKGNYRHKVLLYGSELKPDELSPLQAELRGIFDDSGLKGDYTGRPEWGRGAHVFVTPEHAMFLKDESIRQRLFERPLQNKHTLCSACYYDLVHEALEQIPEGLTGRERFKISRTKEIHPQTKQLWLPQ